MQGIVDSTAPGSTSEPRDTTTPGAPERSGGAPGAEPADAGLAAESSPDPEVPEQWRSGEVRPTHRSKPKPTRTWRTRSDPFASVWHEVLGWLEAEPDATAKGLFKHLQLEHPGTFPPGQLRTLQRRVRLWGQAVARELLWLEGKSDSDSGSPATLSGMMGMDH
jgi:hypothetical protein